MTQQNAALVEQAMMAADGLQDQADKLTQAVAVFRLANVRQLEALPAKPVASHEPPRAAVTALPHKAAPARAAAPRKPAKVAVKRTINAKPNEDEWQEF